MKKTFIFGNIIIAMAKIDVIYEKEIYLGSLLLNRKAIHYSFKRFGIYFLITTIKYIWKGYKVIVIYEKRY